MASGQFRLDLKRDDPRTLMIKIDRRSTFGGRERHHAYRLEAEREIRHINYAKQLSEASFNRSHKEMARRMEFLKGVLESNRERRKIIETDLIERGELQPKRKKKKKSIELPKRQPKPELHNTSVVGSVRRNQMEYVGSKKQSDYLMRSLNDLTASEKRHFNREKQLSKLEEEKMNVEKNEILNQMSNDNSMSVKGNGRSRAETDHVGSQTSVPTRTLVLPELTEEEKRKAPVPRRPGLQRRVSLSNMIANGEISNLQEKAAFHSADGEKPGMARSFYLNTSRPHFKVKPTLPKFKLPPLIKPKVPPLPEELEEAEKTKKSRFSVTLPPQLLPVEYQKDQATENPFMTPDFKPEIIRTRELLDSSKKDEMYVWLGFDTAEEFEQLMAEARKQRPKKKKKPISKAGSNAGSTANDVSDDESSQSGDSLLAEKLQEILTVEKSGDFDQSGPVEKKIASMSRRSSKFALVAPISALGEGQDRKISLKKFVSAARKVLAVNAFKENTVKNESDKPTEGNMK
ncbi:hypothetical protein HOLleu_07475 [Holothuria leucospilota]|uniref:Uncharacterized protein n=1 Tax=Holothuria leucospilota TaxID=206669 RepID=A0A9Q1CHE9_HOLLE|nr:hypothetical protein HOLleu_07475 [Holothuria leucospilota]